MDVLHSSTLMGSESDGLPDDYSWFITIVGSRIAPIAGATNLVVLHMLAVVVSALPWGRWALLWARFRVRFSSIISSSRLTSVLPRASRRRPSYWDDAVGHNFIFRCKRCRRSG